MSSESASQLPPYDHAASFTHTEPPNPTWTYGQKIDVSPEGREWMEGGKEGKKVVDTATENPGKLYQLMISGIVPRPIAFVSSISEAGIENLAPFSWFNMVSHNPPVVSISCSNGPIRLHDTTNNIRATKGFTVNIISEPWVEQANICSIDAPAEFSEWSISGLTKEKSIHVRPALVKESAFSMECELFQMTSIVHPVTGNATTTLILGLVKYVHVRKDMLTEKGTIDPARFKPVGRMGDITYSRLGSGFRLPRPAWSGDTGEGDKVEEFIKSLE